MGTGTKACVNGPGHTTKMAATSIYSRTPLKSASPDYLWTKFVALEMLTYQVCSNHDLRLTLTYLISRSNFLPNGVGENENLFFFLFRSPVT